MINQNLDARRVLNRRIDPIRDQIKAKIDKESNDYKGEVVREPSEAIANRILNFIVEDIGEVLNKK